MMNLLPRKTRVCAALCHLSGLMWLTVIFAGMLPAWHQGWFFIVSLFAPLLVWLFTRRIHDFVDRAGREAVNAQLSMLLYGGCLLFIALIACGMSASSSMQMLLYPLLTILVYLAPLMLTIYIAISTVGAVQALRGHVFHYPFIIRFIPNP